MQREDTWMALAEFGSDQIGTEGGLRQDAVDMNFEKGSDASRTTVVNPCLFQISSDRIGFLRILATRLRFKMARGTYDRSLLTRPQSTKTPAEELRAALADCYSPQWLLSCNGQMY